MAPRQAHRNIQEAGREARPQGIKKLPQNLSAPLRDTDRKRKRAQGPEEPRVCAPTKRPRKLRQASVVGAVKGICDQEKTNGSNDKTRTPIDYWRETGHWPEQYFQQDNQTRKDLNNEFEKDSWYEKYWIPEMNMNHLLARKKSSSSSLHGKQSEAGSAAPSSTTPSDQKPREVKSAPYQDARYQTILATMGSFMGKSGLGITDRSKTLCQTLLEKEQTVPQGSLFSKELFYLKWARLEGLIDSLSLLHTTKTLLLLQPLPDAVKCDVTPASGGSGSRADLLTLLRQFRLVKKKFLYEFDFLDANSPRQPALQGIQLAKFFGNIGVGIDHRWVMLEIVTPANEDLVQAHFGCSIDVVPERADQHKKPIEVDNSPANLNVVRARSVAESALLVLMLGARALIQLAGFDSANEAHATSSIFVNDADGKLDEAYELCKKGKEIAEKEVATSRWVSASMCKMGWLRLLQKRPEDAL
ncbi:hypothetical protein B7494_g3016 [Chlorociboria aeruginascens]|nr:hypothetical protein B7494_g3016 [Chlorociboria aeruginascens]